MKMIASPHPTPSAAFKLLEDNDFNDVDVDDGSIIAIEPGMPNQLENMLFMVPSTSRTGWLETYVVHNDGSSWSIT
jgi:hypothetical protein